MSQEKTIFALISHAQMSPDEAIAICENMPHEAREIVRKIKSEKVQEFKKIKKCQNIK